MTRKYSPVIEGDSNGYSAYVPELPAILVTGRSVEELTARAAEAIRVYWKTTRTERPPASTICASVPPRP
ncbi:MAG: type II toxin-antitoxin system HicB family antitoxin [Acidobacteriia bacterium]|nr:type II toxin-antitoxin system HicB family antitoxin [Terriglobia bacterium]